ncbi:MAG: hypothetical protein AAGH89_19780 [Verrucomicrobiota bacterium]
MSRKVRFRLVCWGVLVGYLAIYFVARHNFADVTFDPSRDSMFDSRHWMPQPQRVAIWSRDEITSFQAGFDRLTWEEQTRLRISETLFWPLIQLELNLFACRVRFAP